MGIFKKDASISQEKGTRGHCLTYFNQCPPLKKYSFNLTSLDPPTKITLSPSKKNFLSKK